MTSAKERAAVLGTGQTRHRSRRTDVSMAGLCREAIEAALADADVEEKEIDALVVGKAPDLFEGVMMPELYLAGALGAAGKPLLRVHTAGSVGGATAIVAANLVQAGLHRRVLAVAWEKQSESNAMWALSIAPPFSVPLTAGAGGYFAPHIREYIRRSGAPGHIGALVAVKDRRAGARNPHSHVRQPALTVEDVLASPMLWDPVRYAETCPSSDGACAMVIGSEAVAAGRRDAAWIRAAALRTEPTAFAAKDHVNPAAGVDCARALWRDGGITDPASEVDVAEIYVPFSWYEPMWLENLGFCPPGQGWRLTEAGVTAPDGALPVNPSGGVLCSNPIGASGMLRFAEAARQVMGRAGDHQVDGARTALGHAYGGGAQFFAMWLVTADRLSLAARSYPNDGNRTVRGRDGLAEALTSRVPLPAAPDLLRGDFVVGHAPGENVTVLLPEARERLQQLVQVEFAIREQDSSRVSRDNPLGTGAEDPGDDFLIDRAGDPDRVPLGDQPQVLNVGRVVVIGHVESGIVR